MSTVIISPKGERRVAAGHPWVYRSDIEEVSAGPGDVVEVRSRRGTAVGHALFSDRSEIVLRMVSRGGEALTSAIWGQRIAAACAYRASLDIDATAFRLIHGEADRLPGLVVDKYGDYLVLQALVQATDKLLPLFVEQLVAQLSPAGILARNDPRVRLLEGLEQRVDVLYGTVPDSIEVREGRVTYDVDPQHGQKTGLFLDQRENRVAAARYARGRALDAFSYNGGFAMALAGVCDEVVAVDISEDAVARIERNVTRNALTNVRAVTMNVFDELRELERRGDRFDTVVLDPPAFAKNKAAIPGARAGYKEINLRAMRLLAQDGYLVTCSCSYNVSEEMFSEVLQEASADSHTPLTLIEKRAQGRDHPILVGVPETHYLKCFILRRVE